MTSRKTSFAVALGITGFVGWALFAEEPSQTSVQKVTTPSDVALGSTGMWVSSVDPRCLGDTACGAALPRTQRKP
jgi:hypothetical protein